MASTITLHVCDDDGTFVSSHTLDSFPCKIGRGKDNQVVLPGWRVGKVHAQNTLRAMDLRMDFANAPTR